jgi:hypothetical protein
MLSGANAFRISDHQLNPREPEDKMQQCYMPCGKRKITIRQPQAGNRTICFSSGAGNRVFAKDFVDLGYL